MVFTQDVVGQSRWWGHSKESHFSGAVRGENVGATNMNKTYFIYCCCAGQPPWVKTGAMSWVAHGLHWRQLMVAYMWGVGMSGGRGEGGRWWGEGWEERRLASTATYVDVRCLPGTFFPRWPTMSHCNDPRLLRYTKPITRLLRALQESNNRNVKGEVYIDQKSSH